MIVLISRQRIFRIIFPVFSLLIVLCTLHIADREVQIAASSVQSMSSVTVILDPGHGGADGGAVSSDGIREAPINLAISQRLFHILRFSGTSVVMTRDSDSMLGDPNLRTLRERKASDLKQRVSMVHSIDHAILISIHQNSLPSSVVTHGAQVFRNSIPAAESLARAVQDMLNSTINRDRHKNHRLISDSIFLMKHVQVPAILVECGFLSNPEEAHRLQNSEHQIALAASVAAGYLLHSAGEGGS